MEDARFLGQANDRQPAILIYSWSAGISADAPLALIISNPLELSVKRDKVDCAIDLVSSVFRIFGQWWAEFWVKRIVLIRRHFNRLRIIN